MRTAFGLRRSPTTSFTRTCWVRSFAAFAVVYVHEPNREMPNLNHSRWTEREKDNLAEVTPADVDEARRSFRNDAEPPFNRMLDAIPSDPAETEPDDAA